MNFTETLHAMQSLADLLSVIYMNPAAVQCVDQNQGSHRADQYMPEISTRTLSSCTDLL